MLFRLAILSLLATIAAAKKRPRPGCHKQGLYNCAGTCVNLFTDTNNCGKCGNVCPAPAACKGGSCVCNPGTYTEGGVCYTFKCGTTIGDNASNYYAGSAAGSNIYECAASCSSSDRGCGVAQYDSNYNQCYLWKTGVPLASASGVDVAVSGC